VRLAYRATVDGTYYLQAKLGSGVRAAVDYRLSLTRSAG
jgi:hypothetical protein